MKKNLILFLFLVTPIALFAQEISENETDKEIKEERPFLKNDIGFIVDDFNRIGLSYRHWFGNSKLKNFGFQVTTSKSFIGSNNFNLNGEVSFLYTLHRSKYMRLFLYQQNGFSYLENDFRSINGSLKVSRTFSNSIGLGIEVIALKRLSINLSAGYGVRTYNSSRELNFKSRLGLEADLGIFYKF